MAEKKVALLVDNRTRDLAVSVLIAHHLGQLGVEAELQPLEAYRAVLAAFKPAMVVINHLTASHLVRWSHRLKELGVLVAVLPNEGLIYDADDLRFAAGRYHNHAHIDHFFTWNEAHRDALYAAGFNNRTQIHLVGVPRFDFYFQPWSRLFARDGVPHPRPQVLCCTNFVFAKFQDLPRIEGEKFLQVFRRMPNWLK
jgi:surface carbohydrate biosynthesis protein